MNKADVDHIITTALNDTVLRIADRFERLISDRPETTAQEVVDMLRQAAADFSEDVNAERLG